MKKLMGMLKVIYENLLMVHHNLVGADWFGTHELVGEWYEEIDKMSDNVIELGISLGYPEPNIQESISYYKVLPSEMKFTDVDSYKICYNFFTDLMHEFEAQKDNVPSDVYSKFEEYICWLRLTAEYKIKHRLYGPEEMAKEEDLEAEHTEDHIE